MFFDFTRVTFCCSCSYFKLLFTIAEFSVSRSSSIVLVEGKVVVVVLLVERSDGSSNIVSSSSDGSS